MIKITEQFFVDIHNMSLQSSLLTIITDCIKLKKQILFFKFTESVTEFNSKKEEYNNFLKEALSLITKLRNKVTELIEKAERTFIDNPNKIDEEKIKGIDRKNQEIEDSVFLTLKALNELEGINVDAAYFARPHLETLLQKTLSHYHGWAENSVKTC